MTAKTAGELALKVWAVILLVSAVLFIPGVVSQFSTKAISSTESSTWQIVAIWNSVHLVLTAAVALLLLRYATRISSLFKVEDSQTDATLDAASLQSVAFGTLGAYFLVLGIRQCAGLAFELATKPAYEQESLAYLWRNQPRALAEAIVQSAAGLLLLLGRHGLSAAWARLHPREHRPSAESEE
jgi:hypothetical protein